MLAVNEGLVDRWLRGVGGALLAFLGFFVFEGWLALVFDAIGFLLLLTALTGYCPLYTLLHINTLGVKH